MTISANSEKDIGELFSTAMEKVRKEGVVTVQDGKTSFDELEVVEGMKFDRGYISPYFVTDMKTQKVGLENLLILCSENKISNVAPLRPIFEQTVKESRQLLILVEDAEGHALAALLVNKLRAGLKVCAVMAPGLGDNRKA